MGKCNTQKRDARNMILPKQRWSLVGIILQIVLIFICIENVRYMNEKLIKLTLCLFFISLFISCIIEVCSYNFSSYEKDYINFILY